MMTRLFTCGFEENNFTATMWNSITGTPTIVTTPIHSGTYALRCNPSTSQYRANRTLQTSITAGSIYMRFYFRVASFPSTSPERIARIGTAAMELMIVDVSGDKRLRIRNGITTTASDSGFNLAIDTWYRIEIRVLVSDTVGQMEGRLFTGESTTADSTWGIGNFSGGNGTDEDTLPTSYTGFDIGNSVNNFTMDIYYDDVIFNDSGGTVFNTWPGPSKTYMLVPNSDVSVTFTPNGATPNYNCVDELPGAAPDDDTTYNSIATDLQEDRLGLTDLGAEVPSDADIIAIDVYARIRGEGTTGARQCRVLLWDEGGTQTNGPTTNLIDNTAYTLMGTNDHLVYDAGSKTKANIDSFDAGYEEIQSNDPMRVTTLWVNVEWKEAPPAALDEEGIMPIGERNDLTEITIYG